MLSQDGVDTDPKFMILEQRPCISNGMDVSVAVPNSVDAYEASHVFVGIVGIDPRDAVTCLHNEWVFVDAWRRLFLDLSHGAAFQNFRISKQATSSLPL